MGTQQVIVMTPIELKQLIINEILPVFQNATEKQEIKTEQKTEYLTRKQAAVFLSISTSTLDRWVKNGAVKKRLVSGSPRFKVTDLEKVLK